MIVQNNINIFRVTFTITKGDSFLSSPRGHLYMLANNEEDINTAINKRLFIDYGLDKYSLKMIENMEELDTKLYCSIPMVLPSGSRLYIIPIEDKSGWRLEQLRDFLEQEGIR